MKGDQIIFLASCEKEDSRKFWFFWISYLLVIAVFFHVTSCDLVEQRKRFSEPELTASRTLRIIPPWKWRQQIPLKRW
jgi:hypothetical protein